MTLALETAPPFLRALQGPAVREAAARMLGQAPVRLRLDRTHFPGRRPVQMALAALMPDGRSLPLLAEHCPEDPQIHAARVRASLGKSRNGQKAGLCGAAILVAEGTGLVLRRPGLDERLPGLRLLHDGAFARGFLADILGRDPGPVVVDLVAHRLGKRAVLRLRTADGPLYVRLRATKSAEDTGRLARHDDLWRRLSAGAGLRIPEPLGARPGLGASVLAELPGAPPEFGAADGAAIARAIGALQATEMPDLPVHRGADEARLLKDWMQRCRHWRPDLARRIDAPLAATLAALAEAKAPPRPCHRDLHERQILVAEGVAGFLDLDTLCLADPALDAGNLLAHLFLAGLDETPLRARLDAPGLGLWRRAALLRLAMIHAFTSMPAGTLDRLIAEAADDARDR